MTCKICGKPVSIIFKGKNSIKTQTVCKDLLASQAIPLVEMVVKYCEICDFYQLECEDHQHYDDSEYFLTTQISEMQKDYQNNIYTYFKSYIQSPVVEIGCGDGYFGEIISKEYEYLAFEPAKSSYEICKEKGLEVINDYFSAKQKFNTIISRQVLEHIEDLNLFLDEIKKSMSDTSIAIFEVPNIVKARNQNRYYDFCPEHKNYFTLSSLGLLFSSRGFNIEEIKKTFNDEYLLIIVSKRLNKFEILDDMVTDLNFKNMVFWGAGSRGISLSHYLNIYPKYFVDTDKNKIGKYIPSSNVEIKDPQELFEDKDIEGVLITGLFYTEEILNQIKNDGYCGKVFIFNNNNQIKEWVL